MKIKLSKKIIGSICGCLVLTPFIVVGSTSCSKDESAIWIKEMEYWDNGTQPYRQGLVCQKTYITINLNLCCDWYLTYSSDFYGIGFSYEQSSNSFFNFYSAYQNLDKELLKKMCDRFNITYSDGGN